MPSCVDAFVCVRVRVRSHIHHKFGIQVVIPACCTSLPCEHAFVRVHVCTRVHVCAVCVRVYVCVCVCMCICVCVHVCVMRKRERARAHACTREI